MYMIIDKYILKQPAMERFLFQPKKGMPLPALNAASCCFHRSFGRNEGQEITPLLDNRLLARYTQKFNDDLPRDPRITFMAQIMCLANTFAEFDGANDRTLVLRTQGLQSCKCRTSWKLAHVQSSN